jgi:Sulfotransferase family
VLSAESRPAKSSYTKLEQLIHRLVLAPVTSRHVAFDIDCMLAKLRGQLSGEQPEGPVYICGMARSGTSILLRLLARLPEFKSLTYRAMPFVMAPRMGKVFNPRNRSSMPPRERLHGDGMLIDLDTPEAFEEVFWLTMNTASAGIKTYDFLTPGEDVLEQFSKYRLLVAGSQRRYLSKNNNNLGRVPELLRNPKAKIVFAIRDPLETATSMHRIHKKLKSADPFVVEYMGWLGHHEFGPGHLPFDFAVPQQDQSLSRETLDYWLDYWIAVHSALLPVIQSSGQIHLLAHQNLLSRPSATLASLAERLKVRAQGLIDQVEDVHPSSHDPNVENVDKARLQQARNLYDSIVSVSKMVR